VKKLKNTNLAYINKLDAGAFFQGVEVPYRHVGLMSMKLSVET
jgi:hypothetical protein